jgi:polypeptide N-acetylgalactosaminyltransferase
MRRPYTGKPGVDTNAYNTLRTSKVWLDEWHEKYLEARPRAKTMEVGDLTERIELKKRLNCRPFEWYIDNVYPKLKPVKHEEL